MPKPFTTHPGSGMHTHVSLFEGDRNAFFEAGARVPAVQDRPAVHRRHPAPRQRDQRRHQPVGQLLQAAARRRRGAVVRSAGATTTARRWSGCRCTSPTRASRPASSCAPSTRPATPTSPSPSCWRPGMKGIEEGYELPARGRGRRLVADRARAQGARASRRCPRACTTRSGSRRTPSCSPRPSASTSSTSSCATSAPSGRSTARQVSAFERDRMLPVL